MSKIYLNLTPMDENRVNKQNTIPSVFQNIEQWKINRRKFVKSLSVAAVLSQLTVLESCTSDIKEEYLANDYLTANQSQIIQKVQNVLFPDDGNGPSCNDIKAFNHIIWVLSDQRKNLDSIKYIIDGMDWTEDTAVETYGRSFIELNNKEVEDLVKIISEEKWGQSWLSIILTLIFEALALDPIYNVNSNSVGWEWLGQFVGSPRPTTSITYGNIFKTIHAE